MLINIILAGTGGQGINTLSKQIRELAMHKGYLCEGATFKGGAQRMGTIYTELRIQTEPTLGSAFSSQIPAGEVHVLIATEPWEALRFANRCNAQTKVLVNAQIEKLYVERYHKNKLQNPLEMLEDIFDSVYIRNFSHLAQSEFNDLKFINQLLLTTAIEEGFLPFEMTDLEGINKKV